MGIEERPDDYTQDGTVSLRGKPVIRSKTGGWKACSFIVGDVTYTGTVLCSRMGVYEVFERMAYYGISTNLVLYLTREFHEGTVKSANNVTNWVGTSWITPILGAYVADAYLGRYWTFVIASIIYLSGMALLTLSVSLPSLRPPLCKDTNLENCRKASTLQLAVFFGALYILALGTGGTKPNISTIGADQFDEFEPKEKTKKLSFFNWWLFSIFIGTLFSNTVLMYLQDNVGWTLGYGLPTVGLAISVGIFLVGTPFYRHQMPTGSPFTRMARVAVAALRKWKVVIPNDPKQLHELDSENYANKGKYRIDFTPSIRFLNKAAVKTGSTNPWMLCTVTQVEETKQMLKMIPILVATFVPGMMLAQLNTLFIKQGTTLDRHIGNFKIPPASLTTFVTLSMLTCVFVYDRIFVKIMRRLTKNPRGITLLQRMGLGLITHTIIMITASLIERYRLGMARKHGLVESGGQVPLTIFILLPQFLLMGMADAFLEVGRIEVFYDQAPDSMKSLGTSYSTTSLGVGNFLGSFVLYTVSHLTKRNGHQGWIQNNLNASRLDHYYAFLAILNFLNFILFLVVTKFYIYKAEVSTLMEVLGEELKGMRLTEPSQEISRKA